MKLISETAKYSLGSYYNERNVGIILRVFETENPQIDLVRLILPVFENALKYDNSELFWLFVRNKRMIAFIKSHLLKPLNVDEQNLHCICL